MRRGKFSFFSKILLPVFLFCSFYLFFQIQIIECTEPDYYKILGVSRDASQAEIKAAHRKLVLKWHPDKNPSPEAQQKFIEISNAFEVLGDEEKRKNYDRFGTSEPRQTTHFNGFQNDFFNFAFNFNFRDFQDPFDSPSVLLNSFNFYDFIYQNSFSLIFFYKGSGCNQCRDILSTWNKFYKQYGDFISMGRMNLDFERNIAYRLGLHREQYAILLFLDGESVKMDSFPNIENMVAFCDSQIPNLVLQISSAQEWDELLNKYPQMVKVLIFSLDSSNFIIKFSAFQFRHSMVFAVSSDQNLASLYHIKQIPSFIIIKEPFYKSEIFTNIDKHSVGIFQENRFMEIPQLQLWNKPILCPSGYFCLLFITWKKNPATFELLYSLKKLIESIPHLKLSWIDAEEQYSFANYFSPNQEDIFILIKEFRFYQVFSSLNIDKGEIFKWIRGVLNGNIRLKRDFHIPDLVEKKYIFKFLKENFLLIISNTLPFLFLLYALYMILKGDSPKPGTTIKEIQLNTLKQLIQNTTKTNWNIIIFRSDINMDWLSSFRLNSIEIFRLKPSLETMNLRSKFFGTNSVTNSNFEFVAIRPSKSVYIPLSFISVNPNSIKKILKDLETNSHAFTEIPYSKEHFSLI